MVDKWNVPLSRLWDLLHERGFEKCVIQAYHSKNEFLLLQVGGTGQRSRVLMTMAAGQIFLDTLVKMGEEASKLEPWDPNNLAVDGKLTAQSIVKDNRRYYFDLKENNRGRFLRVSHFHNLFSISFCQCIPHFTSDGYCTQFVHKSAY